jgi:electron transport complex protein RnfC
VQLLGCYAEFELFDRTPKLDIDQCIECGLCASVCTGRRPLLQLIRLAKREVEASQ